ncbi:N-6 DNA methylase [Flavobacterium sp.]|uniref:class I SAM-dependent DNA methyltransferase n=1 Tax=Flavobacterium sp. TaxID=239 RepID=UPI00261E244F|nr:N-6 DNA methylase [Flavobacterium sp.]
MDITAKLWSFCHILRQDGVDNADYIEQLTYLLFLKMADESGISVPQNCQWSNLITREGEELKKYYEQLLLNLKKEKGILGQIFQEPIAKIKNPVSLKKIVDGIEAIGWTELEKDVQGEAFEGLLDKIANEGKKGAGQFFTPRPLIQAIVEVVRPNPLEKKDFKISDVACGTAGFLTMAVDWAKKNTNHSELAKIKNKSYYGQELVVRPYRLALMNLFLHGIIPNLTLGDSIYSPVEHKYKFDCIITNPPFGTRGVSGSPKIRKFMVDTSNIQINFIQHINEVLAVNGRAAIVLPDSSLTDSKAKEVWKNILQDGHCNLHTILKLPKGTFNPYAAGVKACVVFLQKGMPTKELWVYDARTDVQDVTKTSRPLQYDLHFADFVKSYGQKYDGTGFREESNRFKKYTFQQVVERGYDLSFTNIFEPEKLEDPSFYLEKLIGNYQEQLTSLQALKELLNVKGDA